MRYDVRVTITLKPGVQDIRSREIIGALQSARMAKGVMAAHTGKIIDLSIISTPDTVDGTIIDMCRQLLAHRVIEDFDYRMTAHYAAPNGSIVKMPLAKSTTYSPDSTRIEPLWFQIWKIDLAHKWPAIGPYRILRAEWWAPNPIFFLIRYSKGGVEANLGWRLESSKRVFLDAVEDEMGKKRGATLKKFAPEITDYLIRHLAVYGYPEPELLIEQ